MNRTTGSSAEMRSVSRAAAPLLERIAEMRDSITPERKAEIAAAVAERVALDERRAVLAVGMPSIFDRMPIEAAPPRARAWAAGAVAGGKRNLVLVGASGAGKTKAACALLAWMATRRPCRFAALGDMLRECRATYGGEGSEWAVLAKWAGVGVLCLDDLGKERPTPVRPRRQALRRRQADHLHDAVRGSEGIGPAADGGMRQAHGPGDSAKGLRGRRPNRRGGYAREVAGGKE